MILSMKKLLVLLILCLNLSLNLSLNLFSQGVSINTTGASGDNSAMLDVSSTSQGLLIPRMTTIQRDAIISPAISLLIFNTTTNCYESYVSGAWYSVSCPTPCSPPLAPATGTNTPGSNQVVWSWNTAAGATGYKWGTTSSYTSAKDAGTSNSYTQTGLTCNSSYTLYVWAYNFCGYSSALVLTSATSICGAQCGTQIWTAANLNTGTTVPAHTEQTIAGQKWCYGDIPANCTTYGGLYEWASAMNIDYSYNNNWATVTIGIANETCDPCGPSTSHGGVQGICPNGFHIPSDMEWSRYEYCLENTIDPKGNTSLATFQTTGTWCGSTTPGVGPGDKMKGGGTAMWGSTDTGTNSSGFNALPGGNIYYGSSSGLNLHGYYQSVTEQWATTMWHRVLLAGSAQVARTEYYKIMAMSVRCLQD
jgi:uncharacterized protein (TIGR02145 family)